MTGNAKNVAATRGAPIAESKKTRVRAARQSGDSYATAAASAGVSKSSAHRIINWKTGES